MGDESTDDDEEHLVAIRGGRPFKKANNRVKYLNNKKNDLHESDKENVGNKEI